MAKCIECEFYISNLLDGPGCEQGGDVTNPDKDINCAAAGDKELTCETS